jgi:hypothetical protein
MIQALVVMLLIGIKGERLYEEAVFIMLLLYVSSSV